MFRNKQYTPTLEEFKNDNYVNGKWIRNSEISYNVLKKYYKQQQQNERATKKNDKNGRRK